jgi:hypothetical protein
MAYWACKIWGFHGGDYEEWRPPRLSPVHIWIANMNISSQRASVASCS